MKRLTPEEAFNAIVANRLSVRGIPATRPPRLYQIEHYVTGDTVVEHEITHKVQDFEQFKKFTADAKSFRFDEAAKRVFRIYASHPVPPPKHAGMWMCQKSPEDTASGMIWQTKSCYPAKTLEESVALYLKSINAESSTEKGTKQ